MNTSRKITIIIIMTLFIMNLLFLMVHLFTDKSIPHMIANSTFVILFYNMLLDEVKR